MKASKFKLEPDFSPARGQLARELIGPKVFDSASFKQPFRYGRQDRPQPARKEPISAKEAFVRAILRARGVTRDD